MCGIAGFVTANSQQGDHLSETAARMADTLTSRGPDDSGTWVDPDAGVAFGHRRLAILDLSELGHQPMLSESGRYVLSYNGEIYNFTELRQELESKGHRFRGHSDTEVILGAFTEWGVPSALHRFNGMFAIGAWDRQSRTLHLARDRFGEKPLYYGWLGATFVFASELKAIRAYPGFDAPVDRNALALYLRYTYVPGPYSIYRGVFKLPPGCRFELTDVRGQPVGFSPLPQDSTGGGPAGPVRYWSVRNAVEAGQADPFTGSESEACDRVEELLRDAIGKRMVSDVPLGALLSGGVDSSLVTALMQQIATRRIRTYSIGFEEQGFNEAQHAGAVAAQIGTDHTELYVTAKDALDMVPCLPKWYDEPFADSSQVPTSLLCAMTRRHVTVALSGDGGDEVFGGYTRYTVAPSIWKIVGWAPRWMRRTASSLIRIPNPDQWERMASPLGFLAAEYGTLGTFGEKFHKLADVLAMPGAETLHQRFLTHWERPTEIVRGSVEPRLSAFEVPAALSQRDVVARMSYIDLMIYLPDDILTKVDRASMASSLEVRAPFLDHRLVEFSWRLPTHMKVRGRETKRILKDVLYRHVPRAIVERPKMGFGVPMAAWLRGPLREWAEELLNERLLRDDGFFDPARIREAWQQHLQQRHNRSSQLWSVLMFQAWYHGTSKP